VGRTSAARAISRPPHGPTIFSIFRGFRPPLMNTSPTTWSRVNTPGAQAERPPVGDRWPSPSTPPQSPRRFLWLRTPASVPHHSGENTQTLFPSFWAFTTGPAPPRGPYFPNRRGTFRPADSHGRRPDQSGAFDVGRQKKPWSTSFESWNTKKPS